MNTKKRDSMLVLTECSIMVALATVLSIIKIFELPYGGSITLASMLPIVIISYRYGARVGAFSALAASLIQMLLGLNNFSYFTTWQSVVALAVLDYVVAFTAFGLAGIFKRKIKDQGSAMSAGAALASLLRYVCHVVSGCTVWAGLSIPTNAALIYSISYNATYMIPETIILVLTTAYVGSALDFSKRAPTRRVSKKHDTGATYCYIGAGLALLCALIADTVLVFSRLQSNESGEFSIEGLSRVNWLAVLIITAEGIAFSLGLVLLAKLRAKTKS